MGNPELSLRKEESATAILSRSRHQAMPKRPAPSLFVMKGDDMVCSVQQCTAALDRSPSKWYDELKTTQEDRRCDIVEDVNRVNLIPTSRRAPTGYGITASIALNSARKCGTSATVSINWLRPV